MAHRQKGKDLSGGGVAPPHQLTMYIPQEEASSTSVKDDTDDAGQHVTYAVALPPQHLYLYTTRVEIGSVGVNDDTDNADQHAPCYVLDVSRRSAAGNPFAQDHSRSWAVMHAYDELLSLIIWLGIQGEIGRAPELPGALARRHGVKVSQEGKLFDMAMAWTYLLQAASADGPLVATGPTGPSPQGTLGHRRCADSLWGAVAWLRAHLTRQGRLPKVPSQKAGDWLLSDIFAKWPGPIAAELAARRWPLTDVEEVEALLAAPNASPRAVVAFEFTGAVRDAYSQHWHYTRVAISVDTRTSIAPGPHICMDVREVLWRKRWEDAYMHPPCTHHILSDTKAALAKQLDGRAFWGVALFLYSWCTQADRIVVEQPPTLISDFYMVPTQQLRPCDVGDNDDKQIHLFERGGRTPIQRAAGAAGSGDRKRRRDFSDPEDHDKWRSSWARLPRLCRAVVAAADESAPPAPDLCYDRELERFAGAWHDAGLPLPHDYATADARPIDPHDQAYLNVRGRGDGRRLKGVIPRSRRIQATPSALLGLCESAYMPADNMFEAAPQAYA